MFDIFLGLFLLISPIFILLGNNARLNGIFASLQFYQFNSLSLTSGILQLQIFQYLIVLLFFVSLFSKSRNIKDKYFACLFGMFLLSMLIHTASIKLFVPVFLGFLLYYLVINYAVKIKSILLAVVLISLLNTIFATLQYFGINLIYFPIGRIDGLMSISSHLGAYQAIAMPICYYFNPFLAIIPFIGLVLSGNMTAIAGAIVGMIYLLRKKIACGGSIILMVTISTVTILLFKFFKYWKLTLRFWGWKETIKAIINKPFGYTLGSLYFTSPLGYIDNSYNIYLDTAYYLGIIGLVILLLFIMNKFMLYRKNITKLSTTLFSSCLIALIIGLGQSFINFPRIIGTVIVLFAMLKISVEKENTDGIC